MEFQTKLFLLVAFVTIFTASFSSATIIDLLKEIVQVAQQTAKTELNVSEENSVCTEKISFQSGASCSCSGNVKCEKGKNSVTCVNKEGDKCWETFCMQNPNGSCVCVRAQLGTNCQMGGPVTGLESFK